MNSKLDKNNEITDEEEYSGLSSKNLMIAVVCVSIFGFALMIGFSQNPGQGVIAANQDGENLVIKLTDVKPEAKFYYYEINDVKIKFFAVLGDDEQPHIAFDACDSCYAAKKGYLHVGSYMSCNNCGNVFQINSIGTENLSGGCWPSFLPVTIADGKILIKISDVIQKQWMFD